MEKFWCDVRSDDEDRAIKEGFFTGTDVPRHFLTHTDVKGDRLMFTRNTPSGFKSCAQTC